MSDMHQPHCPECGNRVWSSELGDYCRFCNILFNTEYSIRDSETLDWLKTD